MNREFEYIIVGSGPSGAQAAQTLAEAGKNVAILDVGFTDEKYKKIIPDDDFVNLRENDTSQYRYFAGDDFEAVPLDDLKTGAQLTPPRKHIIKDVDKMIPLSSETFFPMESLALGGLSAGWGLGCYVYSDNELKKAGLDPELLKRSYEVISDRIGVSCVNDDSSKYSISHLKNILPPLRMDNSIGKIYQKYLDKKDKFSEKNIFLGNPAMAMLSVDHKNRRKTEYKDMDFYANQNGSSYRTSITIEELKKYSGFTYINKMLVLRFIEAEGKVIVETKNIENNEVCIFSCKKLLLAAGPLGSARIVMRSFPEKIQRLPLLCNPYTYMPCIHLSMLGKPLERFRSGMGQAVMYYDPDGKNENVSTVSLFTYRSLMLYRLVKETPIDIAGGRIIMQYLQSAFVIAGIHHPDNPSSEKYLELKKDDSLFTGDKLHAYYSLSKQEKEIVRSNEKILKAALRKLGCYPVMRMDPGYGSSIHYAGTVPFCNEDKFGTTAVNGKLNRTKNVFMADSSGFLYLPAKGITFTIMANAHVVANNAMRTDE
jgi:hypothetical protein